MYVFHMILDLISHTRKKETKKTVNKKWGIPLRIAGTLKRMLNFSCPRYSKLILCPDTGLPKS
jgi:hypothetical protein